MSLRPLLFILLWLLFPITGDEPQPAPAPSPRENEHLAAVERAREDTLLARSASRHARAQLEQMEEDETTPETHLLAQQRFVAEIEALLREHENTLADLEALLEQHPPPETVHRRQTFLHEVHTLALPQSEDNQMQELLAQFEASLNQFDTLLLQHMQQIRDRMAVRQLSGAEAATPRARAAAEAAALLRDLGVDPSLPTAEPATAPSTTAPGAETTQPARPPSQKEDIVARQLREAAERETDPELREKLWLEYEAYLDGRS